MTTGKARVAKSRTGAQMTFDEMLIEEYRGGDPPDEFDSRRIQIHFRSDPPADRESAREAAVTSLRVAEDRLDDRFPAVVRMASSDRPPAPEVSSTRADAPAEAARAGGFRRESPRRTASDGFKWSRFALGAAAGLAAAAILMLVAWVN